MFSVEIKDDFTNFIIEWFSVINVMKNTLIDFAEKVGETSKPKVPYDTGALEDSYKYNVVENSDFYEITMIYSSIASNGFDYANIQHEREDFHHPIKGEPYYLVNTIGSLENGLFVELESDYLSLFK